MDTAPKDGTRILVQYFDQRINLFGPNTIVGEPKVAIACYIKLSLDRFIEADIRIDGTQLYIKKEDVRFQGWTIVTSGLLPVEIFPSGWMPLPLPSIKIVDKTSESVS